jgi:hypothetical protein
MAADGPSSIAGAAELVLVAAAELALKGDEGEVLIPRTPLRDALAHAYGVSLR